ncbi:MAG TPA: hypothetical protein VFT21_01530 [Gemmatimonadaceae bacterium]|nr:hypothetical protein [Gemmatimonadaceae bacterium]
MRAFGRLTPFLIAVVLIFAALQLYTSARFGLTGQYAFAALYGVFAFAGVALARALWINRKKYG